MNRPIKRKNVRAGQRSKGMALRVALTCAGGVSIGTLVGVLLLAMPPKPAEAGQGAVREKVSVAGIGVGGLSQEDLKKLVGELAARLEGLPVVVSLGSRSEKSTAGKLGANVDAEAAIAAALTAPAEAPSLIDRIREKFTGPEPLDVPLNLTVDKKATSRTLARFSIRVGAEPRNARLTKIGGRFVPRAPKPGKVLNTTAIAKALQEALDASELRSRIVASLEEQPQRPAWLQSQEPLTIEGAVREGRPRISLEELKPITARLVTFRTGLGRSSRNRVHNISLACKAIDGTVLLPGDVFSYNEIVGPRVPSAGFKEAPVIIRGELQPGTGGGICQVSSTLYNAALLADLKIVRRSHHAFPVHYLPAGRDATVVDGSIDFRFRNSLEHPIAIDAKVSGGSVTFNIYGHPGDKREVQLSTSGHASVSAGVQTISDPRLPKGRRVVEKRAKSGLRVTLTRVVKKDGQVLRTEVVSRDYYRPFNGVVRVGTAAAAKKPDKTPAADPAHPDEKPTPPKPADDSGSDA
jgi:vancomycin resistance protein YoaR